jgi:hypothetical protein
MVLYSYSTTNKMHLFLKLFILVKRSTCFGGLPHPSSGAQLLCIQQQACVKQLLLLAASGDEVELELISISFPLAASSNSCLTRACCRMCSFVLLLMDGKTVRNM